MLDLNDDGICCTTKEQLEALNLLRHPVWVFDIDQRRMFWANTAALEVWNAESLPALLNRDFEVDMSDSAKSRLRDMQTKFQRNECVTEQWTFYPQGRGATTLAVTCSAIRIQRESIAMLVEAELLNQTSIPESAVRKMEIVRHLPFAVSQYSIEGKLLYQNPEATNLFGATVVHEEKRDQSDDSILPLFVDQSLGKSALQQVGSGVNFNGEVELSTREGKKWFHVGLRRTRDPVTSNFVILLSASDISEVIKARQDASRAEKKSEFMAVMAHEIRTPLHQMIGYLDLLESTQLNTDQHDHLNQIQSSSSMLMCIINDLLDFSKLECGQVQIETVNFSLEGIIEGCLDCIKPEAERKNLLLQSHLSDNLPVKLLGDPNRLRQILLNLLSNAVKFTDTGSICVTVTPVDAGVHDTEGTWLRFEVADTGIGIDPLEQEAVFDKYRQANASVARHFGGTGLGLAICKGLSELMGGSIGLQSEVGVGTSMFFQLPFQLPSQIRDTIALDGRGVVNEVTSLHILVAEDNRINQKVMRAMLERLGHVVTVAENGQIALDELNRTRIDLVLMDVQMPVMDGIECTKQIRRAMNQSISTVPVIGLTASFQNADLEYYQGIGMDSCLGKPLRMEQLKQAIALNWQQQARAMLMQ